MSPPDRFPPTLLSFSRLFHRSQSRAGTPPPLMETIPRLGEHDPGQNISRATGSIEGSRRGPFYQLPKKKKHPLSVGEDCFSNFGTDVVAPPCVAESACDFSGNMVSRGEVERDTECRNYGVKVEGGTDDGSQGEAPELPFSASSSALSFRGIHSDEMCQSGHRLPRVQSFHSDCTRIVWPFPVLRNEEFNSLRTSPISPSHPIESLTPAPRIMVHYGSIYSLVCSHLYSDFLHSIQLRALPSVHLTLAAVGQSDYERWLGDHQCSRQYFTMLVSDQAGWESFLEGVEHWVRTECDGLVRLGVNMH
ncbi:hypothetical protein BGX38DRAFT_1233093 [Terfezia claveryi]|nr:hypothetical protein BGX38DRAFT_1233093 [Terfezia claveryi]